MTLKPRRGTRRHNMWAQAPYADPSGARTQQWKEQVGGRWARSTVPISRGRKQGRAGRRGGVNRAHRQN